MPACPAIRHLARRALRQAMPLLAFPGKLAAYPTRKKPGTSYPPCNTTAATALGRTWETKRESWAGAEPGKPDTSICQGESVMFCKLKAAAFPVAALTLIALAASASPTEAFAKSGNGGHGHHGNHGRHGHHRFDHRRGYFGWGNYGSWGYGWPGYACADGGCAPVCSQFVCEAPVYEYPVCSSYCSDGGYGGSDGYFGYGRYRGRHGFRHGGRGHGGRGHGRG